MEPWNLICCNCNRFMCSNVWHCDVWVPAAIILVSLFFTAGTDKWFFHTVHKPSWQSITQFCQVNEVCQDAAHCPDQIPEPRKLQHYITSPQGGGFHRKQIELETEAYSVFLVLFQIKGEIRHTLSCCLNANETFLKKSLQAALKRISISWGRHQNKRTISTGTGVCSTVHISKMDFITTYCAFGPTQTSTYVYILCIYKHVLSKKFAIIMQPLTPVHMLQKQDYLVHWWWNWPWYSNTKVMNLSWTSNMEQFYVKGLEGPVYLYLHI